MRKKEKKQKVSNGQIYLKSLKFFRGIKNNTIILGVLYVILGIIGIIVPIIQGNIVTSITELKVNSVIKVSIIFLIVVTLDTIVSHGALMFWIKKIKPVILNNIRKDIIQSFMKLRLRNLILEFFLND